MRIIDGLLAEPQGLRKIGEVLRILCDANNGIIDLEEIHADAVARVPANGAGAETDDGHVVKSAIGGEREHDVAERPGGMVIRGRQETDFPPCVSSCQSPF